MAVTKIWAIKDSLSRVVDYATNPNKTIYSDLKNAIHYAENGEKTISEDACFVTGVNCNADRAYEEMKKSSSSFWEDIRQCCLPVSYTHSDAADE